MAEKSAQVGGTKKFITQIIAFIIVGALFLLYMVPFYHSPL